jgi:hypothetical protein
MSVSIGSASSTHTFAQSFNEGVPLGLQFMRDNESFERHQLNSTAFDCLPFPGGGQTGGCFLGPGPFPAPEPGTLVLLGLGLAGLAFTRRRRP